jgi:hypothetical protein
MTGPSQPERDRTGGQAASVCDYFSVNQAGKRLAVTAFDAEHERGIGIRMVWHPAKCNKRRAHGKRGRFLRELHTLSHG